MEEIYTFKPFQNGRNAWVWVHFFSISWFCVGGGCFLEFFNNLQVPGIWKKSEHKIQQFYYKRIYIERCMLIGSFCSHTLDTAKCNKQKKNKNRSKYYYMIRSRNFLRSDRPKYHLGYHNVKYLASYPGLISEFSEQFTQHCYIYTLSNLG